MTEENTDFTNTPEFASAVDAAVERALARLAPAVAAPRASVSSDQNFVDALAMAISDLSSQQVGEAKRVSPDEVKRRANAKSRMYALIRDAQERDASGEKDACPLYRLMDKVFLDGEIVESIYLHKFTKEQMHQEVNWPGEPNEQMIPRNESAIAIHAAFMESIGNQPTDAQSHEPLNFFVDGGGRVQRVGLRLRDTGAAVNIEPIIRRPSADPQSPPVVGMRRANHAGA